MRASSNFTPNSFSTAGVAQPSAGSTGFNFKPCFGSGGPAAASGAISSLAGGWAAGWASWPGWLPCARSCLACVRSSPSSWTICLTRWMPSARSTWPAAICLLSWRPSSWRSSIRVRMFSMVRAGAGLAGLGAAVCAGVTSPDRAAACAAGSGRAICPLGAVSAPPAGEIVDPGADLGVAGNSGAVFTDLETSGCSPIASAKLLP